MAEKKHWTPEMTATAVEKRSEGWSWDQIGQLWNFSRHVVIEHLRGAGYVAGAIPRQAGHQDRPHTRDWADQRITRILQMRDQGMTWREIGKEIGLDRQAIVSYLRDRGYIEAAISNQPKSVAKQIGPIIEHDTRRPMPPGHPVSWGAITDGTCLDGSPFE